MTDRAILTPAASPPGRPVPELRLADGGEPRQVAGAQSRPASGIEVEAREAGIGPYIPQCQVARDQAQLAHPWEVRVGGQQLDLGSVDGPADGTVGVSGRAPAGSRWHSLMTVDSVGPYSWMTVGSGATRRQTAPVRMPNAMSVALRVGPCRNEEPICRRATEADNDPARGHQPNRPAMAAAVCAGRTVLS